MAARRSALLSPATLEMIARELGVAATVQQRGWGEVSSRTCGEVVAVAVAHAQRLLAGANTAGEGSARLGGRR
jgi:small acid-soluble spore protein F (minor alpha/beta-type SASP)